MEDDEEVSIELDDAVISRGSDSIISVEDDESTTSGDDECIIIGDDAEFLILRGDESEETLGDKVTEGYLDDSFGPAALISVLSRSDPVAGSGDDEVGSGFSPAHGKSFYQGFSHRSTCLRSFDSPGTPESQSNRPNSCDEENGSEGHSFRLLC